MRAPLRQWGGLGSLGSIPLNGEELIGEDFFLSLSFDSMTMLLEQLRCEEFNALLVPRHMQLCTRLQQKTQRKT